jgi:hypothetical protein
MITASEVKWLLQQPTSREDIKLTGQEKKNLYLNNFVLISGLNFEPNNMHTASGVNTEEK